jgi:hypothetical protein
MAANLLNDEMLAHLQPDAEHPAEMHMAQRRRSDMHRRLERYSRGASSLAEMPRWREAARQLVVATFSEDAVARFDQAQTDEQRRGVLLDLAAQFGELIV